MTSLKRSGKRVALARSAGFSMVELLIGVALGTFVLLGLVTAMAGLLRGEALAAARLGNEVRNAAFVLEREVTRAGYDGAAATHLKAGAADYANPFSQLDVTTPGCVLYSYDLNSSGTQEDNTTASLPVDERYAIVLSASQLFLRTGGVQHDCDVTKGTWEALTDVSVVKITGFTLDLAGTLADVSGSTKKLQSRTLTYTLTGELTRAPSKMVTRTSTLILPNDILI